MVVSQIINVLYDGLFRQPLPDGVSMVAYAYDIALVIVVKTTEDIKCAENAHTAIDLVMEWLNTNGLGLLAIFLKMSKFLMTIIRIRLPNSRKPQWRLRRACP